MLLELNFSTLDTITVSCLRGKKIAHYPSKGVGSIHLHLVIRFGNWNTITNVYRDIHTPDRPMASSLFRHIRKTQSYLMQRLKTMYLRV